MPTIIPNSENISSESNDKITYSYFDVNSRPVFKTKEIYKNEDKYIFYPYSIGQNGIQSKKIKIIEIHGWKDIDEIPKDIKSTGKYGFGTQRMRIFGQYIYPRFKNLEKLVIGINKHDRFNEKTITLNWANLNKILNYITTEKRFYDRTRKSNLNNLLSDISTKFSRENNHLSAGQLDAFLKKFDSFEKISKNDIDSLSKVIETAPTSSIAITENFIKTKDRINKVFLEDIISKFEKLMTSKTDNEKSWQKFFEENSWILNHLFPFEVILKEKEAYVGGKTISNNDGRVVDFLFENGFQDNFALLEVKTHKKDILKKIPYRKPDAFAYSDDLSGGISQCLDQKDIFTKENPRLQIMNPKSILIIGNKGGLNANQRKCFELLRANLKNIEVVTFDELLLKLKGLLKVLAI